MTYCVIIKTYFKLYLSKIKGNFIRVFKGRYMQLQSALYKRCSVRMRKLYRSCSYFLGLLLSSYVIHVFSKAEASFNFIFAVNPMKFPWLTKMFMCKFDEKLRYFCYTLNIQEVKKQLEEK